MSKKRIVSQIRRQSKARLRRAVQSNAHAERIARDVLTRSPGLQSALGIAPEHRSRAEEVHHLARRLLEQRRFDDAVLILRREIDTDPLNYSSLFLLGVALLYTGEFSESRRLIDRVYDRTHYVDDETIGLPGLGQVVAQAGASSPDWTWPKYMTAKSSQRLLATKRRALTAIVDDFEPALLISVTDHYGSHQRRVDPLATNRMRIIARDFDRRGTVRLRHKLSRNKDVDIQTLARASNSGTTVPTTLDSIASEDLVAADLIDLDTGRQNIGFLRALLQRCEAARVVRVNLYSMTLDDRLRALKLLDQHQMRRHVTSLHLIGISTAAIEDRRAHSWISTEADFRIDLLDDYTARLQSGLAESVQDILIRNQIRFFTTPTDAPRTVRFSIGNADKDYVLSRISELTDNRFRVHIEGLASVRASTPLVRLYPVTAEARHLGETVELDFWTRRNDYVRTSNLNPHVTAVPKAYLERTMFGYNPPFLLNDKHKSTSMLERLDLSPAATSFGEPVDIIYTWVNGGDPEWLKRRNQALAAAGEEGVDVDVTAARFRSNDELRYSMRSVYSFMPAVNKIYIVTDGQCPDWLDVSHPGVEVVDHRTIFGSNGTLPTFNSNAIETQLGNIPDLGEYAIYFNDDVLLLGPSSPLTFFHSNGIAKNFFERVPNQYGSAHPTHHKSKNAVLNSAAAFEARYGKSFHQFHRHTPFPLRRSALREMNVAFADVLAATSHQQFRSNLDIAPISSLYQWFCLVEGLSVPADIRATYLNLGDPNLERRLTELRITANAVLCVNDSNHDDLAPEETSRLLRATLERLYPAAAPWEKSS